MQLAIWMMRFLEGGQNSLKPNIDYSLYLVTDRDLMSTKTVEDSVEQAIRGGCTLIQLREKKLSSKDFYETARKVRAVTSKFNIPFIVNDRVDIALAVDADGVHIGQDDLPVEQVRKLIGPNKIVGVSASNLSEALTAVEEGADYLGIGAMFSTNTKTDADATSIEELTRIRKVISLPLVVIGGINKETIPQFKDIKIDGYAIVSAIVNQPDIIKATQELKQLIVDSCMEN